MSAPHACFLCQKVLELGNLTYIHHVLWKIIIYIHHLKNGFTKQAPMMRGLQPMSIELFTVSEIPEAINPIGVGQKTLEGWVTLAKNTFV